MIKTVKKFDFKLCIPIIISLILFISVIPFVNGKIIGLMSPVVDLTWNSMINNRKIAISMLPASDEFPENTTSWTDYAEKCFENLLLEDDCWISEASVDKGFRPYVKGADGWGGEDWTRESTELMAGIDVIWPMYRYLQLHPNNTRETMVDEFIQELPSYYATTLKQTLNNPFTGHTDYKHDSWYYMENSVLKFGHLYLISNISSLQLPYTNSLESGLKMADNFDFLFPQFVQAASKTASEGYNTVNYCTAGLLAYSLINAYELTENTTYLIEAEKALVALRGVELPYETAYEPQELAAGAAAAAKMIQYAQLIGSSNNFAQLALDLFYAQVQTLYYNDGTIDWSFGFNPSASLWLPASWRDGMHSPYSNPRELGTGGINAPAFKENIEAIMFWMEYLKNIYDYPEFRAVEPLKILNLNRIKNFYFFSPNIPDQYERFYGPTTLQYIPYEDIDYHASRGTYDPDPYKAGYNGKEIYGAGEVLWNYLMFEALGEAADNKSLIVNLNIFDKNFPTARNDRVYIIFNPYNEQKTLTFTLKHLTEAYNLYSNHTLLLQNVQPENSFNITLPALGSAYITLTDPSVTSLSTTPNPTGTSQSIPSDNPNLGESFIILAFFGFSIIALITVIYLAFKQK
ncbi:MAG: hypothetical protein ACFFAU_12855 [Candidatus Hodarchaeota archaeon]